MREILFRGKSVDKNEFIYGLPYSSCYDEEIDQIVVHDYHVDIRPETIGQFTGLSDKYGDKIFEGDKLLYDGVEGTVYYENSSFFVKFEYLRSSHLLGELERDLEIIGSIYDI